MSFEYTIDLRTKFILDSRKVYILFPGDSYRYYDDMREQAAVFLDIPGFPFSIEDDFSKVEDLVERIIVAERIKDWHDAGRPEEHLPARQVDELNDYRTSPGRQQFAGKIRNFFKDPSKGDIVIVPCKDFSSDVLFGEFTDDGVISSASVTLYQNEVVPCRRVQWVYRTARSRIPSWLERKIGSPNALRQIEKSYFDSIFDMMYERYHFSNQFVCKFKIGSQNFSSLDDFLFQQVVLYVSALHEHLMDENIQRIADRSLASVAGSISTDDDIPLQRIAIASPGHIVLYSRSVIPIIVGSVMVLATTAGPSLADGSAGFKVVNSVDNSEVSKACQIEIHSEISDDITAMGFKRWQELCELQEQNKARTQVDPGMGVKQAPLDRTAK